MDKDEDLDVLFTTAELSVNEEKALELERILVAIGRAVFFLLSGIVVLTAPWLIYFGEIYCKQHNLEPPNIVVLFVSLIGTVSAVLRYGYKKPDPIQTVEQVPDDSHPEENESDR